MEIWVIFSIQKPSHHILQTFRPLRMFKVVFHDSSLYPKPLSLYGLPRAYARGVGGVNPPLVWYVTKTLLPAKRRLIVSACFLLVNLSTSCKNCSYKCSDKVMSVFTPLFERSAWYFCSYELLCRTVECIFLRYPNLGRWYLSLYSVPRAYARGGAGVKLPAWAWYFTKTLLPAQRTLIVFAYFLLVNLST